MASIGEHAWASLHERLAHVRRELAANASFLEQNRRQLELVASASLDRRELLRKSLLARLNARLESQPVIEQAKGILMAQTGCSAEEAFGMLRRASQRTNRPLRELAREVVDRARRRPAPTRPFVVTQGLQPGIDRSSHHRRPGGHQHGVA